MPENMARKNVAMVEQRPYEPPLVYAPLAPVISLLLAIWSGMLDVAIIVSHLMSNGRYPSLFKVVVCTTITVAVNAYCWYTASKHRECRAAIARLIKEGIVRPALMPYQALFVVLAAMGFSALGGWA